jgi:sigma-B regulation protein RsbU (phosphoserine phosphatase)
MGLISPNEHRVELLSAGQGPILFFESQTSSLQEWDADDLPLGIAEGVEFGGERRIMFSPGDMLVLITDGFFEAVNDANEQFGIPAVEQFIREHHQLSPAELIRELYERVKTHAAGQEQGDDMTALVIKRSTNSDWRARR